MKLHLLLPLIALTVNVSGRPAPDAPLPAPKTVIHPPKKDPPAEEEIVPWATDRKLAWEDFRCSPQKQGDAVASTSTSLGISYQVKNGELTYNITCHFSKKKSWGLLKTEYILAHEQAHFDITELHARKLYKALQEYRVNPETFKKDIAAIYERIVKEKEEMQEAYDSQTDHSRRRRVQWEWLLQIEDLLAETAHFAVYP